jgi:hypothetical protein
MYPAPGVAAKQAWLKIKDADNVGSYTTNALMTVPAMQDITINNAKDVFTWTQLDSTGKFSIPTTSDNSISGNVVVDKDTFYGDGTTDGIQDVGMLGASNDSVKVAFELYTGDDSEGVDGKYISGTGYITGLAPTVSSDSPVWVSPFTITVDGVYTIADTAQVTAG